MFNKRILIAALILLALLLGVKLLWGAVDANGWVITGLSSIQDNLLGPVIPMGNSPWSFGDAAETGVADNLATKALAETPALSTALSGTVSWTLGGNVVTTTVDQRTPLSGKSWVAFAWTSVDGAGTGRAICAISSVTATQIICQSNIFAPTSSGITAYLLPPAGPSGFDVQGWVATNPSISWNYYDVAIGFWRLYYRTADSKYLTWARSFADITWQWTLDHGYGTPYPRASSLLSQFMRALDGHSERFAGLYTYITFIVAHWGDPSGSPNIDNREHGYTLWAIATGAKTDTDATRHTQYCSWLTSFTTAWNSVQSADGSWGEAEYALNRSYVSAPKTFSLPLIYGGAPWREAINVKAMESAYESLNDTSSQGCNNTTLAAGTLNSIKKAVAWQNTYGRDSVGRGIYYTVNSQSAEQTSVFPIPGTLSINLGSTSLAGVGTNWQTAGYCDGSHFLGINTAGTVYKIQSCTSNTLATINPAFGFYSEMSNVVASANNATAPAMSGVCNSAASNCFGADRNLTRTTCGGFGWVYSKTLLSSDHAILDECLSATLGGPSSGLTTAANIGTFVLPCAGPGCDGYVNDMTTGAPSCLDQGPPCVYGGGVNGNLGKNFGETWGAPGIDNALAYRLLSPLSVSGGNTSSGKIVVNGKIVTH